MRVLCCCGLLALLAPVGSGAGGWRAVEYIPGSSTKVCQLTGDFDRPWGRPTLSLTDSRAGVRATDLGSSFEHKGKLCFLFGDTWGRKGDRDSLACTTSRDPKRIELEFLKASDGKWLPLSVPGVSLGAFEIPSYGVSIGGAMYVVFTTGHSKEKVMGRSILAVSEDDGRTFEKLYELSADKFINAALWKAGRWLYVFGSGKYRHSSVCLARIPQRDVRRKQMLRYFTGLDEEGAPGWSSREADAITLFQHNVVGEFSVAFARPLGCYLMLYNSRRPRGIVVRSAPEPWGPWSDATVIFNPWRDNGYGRFLHIPAGYGRATDSFSDPKRSRVWGGEYGPYLMARYITGDAAKCRIYYTMSTWNPYQVVVMRSDLRLASERSETPAPAAENKAQR